VTIAQVAGSYQLRRTFSSTKAENMFREQLGYIRLSKEETRTGKAGLQKENRGPG